MVIMLPELVLEDYLSKLNSKSTRKFQAPPKAEEALITK
jgi:hypothetical protein